MALTDQAQEPLVGAKQLATQEPPAASGLESVCFPPGEGVGHPRPRGGARGAHDCSSAAQPG
eukprot:10758921-Alexandrium_andersonii.AAC.1